MHSLIPIYYISCFDKNDYHKHQSLAKIKNKIARLEKALPNPIHLFRHPTLDVKEAHQTLLINLITAKHKNQTNSRYVVILEEDTSILDIPRFRNLIKYQKDDGDSSSFPSGKILHLGGYLEEKSEEENLKINQNTWVVGKSRNHFAYIVDLAKFELIDIKSKDIKDKDSFEQFIYSNASFMLTPILVTPFLYDMQKGKMGTTHIGYSIGQFEETNQHQLTLKLPPITDNNLPRITLITVINNQRLWWPLIRLNLDNIIYPTHKMKWIIIETTGNDGYTIEDLLPKTRGKPGGWELEYIKYDSYNHDFMKIVKYLETEGKLVGDFAVEFDPQSFYPTFTLMSRVKTLIQYPNINLAGTTQTQAYSLKSDYTTLTGKEDQLELIKGSRIIRRSILDSFNFNIIMRIPYQFTNYLITSDKFNQNRYQGLDTFPEYLEKEEYFPELILLFEDIKNKITE
jgi:hypothetical protein